MLVTERDLVRLLQMLPAPDTCNQDSYTIAIYRDDLLRRFTTVVAVPAGTPNVALVTFEKRVGPDDPDEIQWALNV